MSGRDREGVTVEPRERVSTAQMSRLLATWELAEGTSLHEQLAAALRELVSAGALRPGTILPSQRELCRILAVSRTTVAVAYDTLRDEGWLESRQGGVTWVRSVSARNNPAWLGDRLTSYAEGDSALDLTSGAMPASPVMARVLRGNWVWELRRLLAVDRFIPAGWSVLRERVAAEYTAQGLATDADSVLVTNGAHHALTLVAECLVGMGDVVLVEDPTYRGALDVFGRAGARVIGVPTDVHGIDPFELERLVRQHRPRLLYVLPTAHNVTGVTWSAERRAEVARILTDARLTTVDDASTADLHAGEFPGWLGALLPRELSVTLGSLTKLFWSGLRVGWCRGPAALLAAMLRDRLTSDLAGSLPSQVLVAECLRVAGEARQLRSQDLAAVRAGALELLATHLPHWRPWPAPGGGCLWVDTGEDATALAATLRRDGILLNAGPTFSPTDGFETFLRLPLGRPAALAAAIPRITGRTTSR